ncbi:MAG: polysaccharide deacetylase family protein [Candidatus Roizmanbacteria bacterium]|nr:polysaccharide deacetylase family protein [Candidatus Roizmanbacteria bacterium]
MRKHRWLIGFVGALFLLILGSVVRTQLQNRMKKQFQKNYDVVESFTAPNDMVAREMKYFKTPEGRQWRIPIIMYHYVEPQKNDGDTIRRSLTIPPELFEKQLQTLSENNIPTYFVRDIPAILSGDEEYATPSVVLTFDDGYQDFYTVVFPLLKKYHVKATVYIINRFLGWKDFLTTKQLRELGESSLVEIGAHTLNHAYLKGLDTKTAAYQIMQSKRELEELLGKPVETFAYPYGEFDPETMRIVKEASYSAAVSVVPGMEQSIANQYYLYRIRAGNLSSGDAMLHVLGVAQMGNN